jgi:hypothetical protein
MAMHASLLLTLPLWLAAARADAPAPKEPPPREEVRQVVAAIVRAAEDNAARPRGRLQGDALADYYVRRAAAAAEARHVSPRACLVALGVALDDTDVLRKNPLTRPYLTEVESDDERRQRLRVLGRPSLRGRHDWLLHFAVTAGIAGHSGLAKAEQAGVMKEVADSLGTSGFSFGDLAADYTGLEFSRRLLGPADEARRRLHDAAEHFDGDRYLPAGVKGLEEDIPWKRLVKDYGNPQEERFRRACEKVHKLVLEAPAFRADDR